MIDFINRDHEEMHYALINNGFILELMSVWDEDIYWDFNYQNGLERISFRKNDSCVLATVLHNNEEDFEYDTLLNGKNFEFITSYFTNENTCLTIDSTLRRYCGFIFNESLNKWIYNLGVQDVEAVDNKHMLSLTLSSGECAVLEISKQITGRSLGGFVTMFVKQCKEYLKERN